MGLINGEQLEEALMHQSVAEARLGDTLIELGYITAAELTEAISIQLGYPKIIPNAGIIDKTLLSGLSPSYMKTNLFIPAFKQDGILTVIMANPSTTRNRAVDQQVIQVRGGTHIAPAADISTFIDRFTKGIEFGQRRGR